MKKHLFAFMACCIGSMLSAQVSPIELPITEGYRIALRNDTYNTKSFMDGLAEKKKDTTLTTTTRGGQIIQIVITRLGDFNCRATIQLINKTDSVNETRAQLYYLAHQWYNQDSSAYGQHYEISNTSWAVRLLAENK